MSSDAAAPSRAPLRYKLAAETTSLRFVSPHRRSRCSFISAGSSTTFTFGSPRSWSQSKRFYRAVFDVARASSTLSFKRTRGHFHADELWVDKADGQVSHVHLAFQAAGSSDRRTPFHPRCARRRRTRPWRPRRASPTIPAITAPSCSIPTATTSKPCITGRLSRSAPIGRHHRAIALAPEPAHGHCRLPGRSDRLGRVRAGARHRGNRRPVARRRGRAPERRPRARRGARRAAPDGAIHATAAEALARPCDVFVEYTKPGSAKANILAALERGAHVVVGTSGLTEARLRRDRRGRARRGRGVLACGNFALTVVLLQKFAEAAARLIPQWEIIDYAHDDKADAPSGTARELAHRLAKVRAPQPTFPSRRRSARARRAARRVAARRSTRSACPAT